MKLKFDPAPQGCAHGDVSVSTTLQRLGELGAVDERARELQEQHEDERTRHFAAKRAKEREKEIRADERRRMLERDLERRSDDTGFSDGSLV